MYTHGNDILWSSGRAVCVVQLVSMADSRTEMLHKLLPASNSHHCLTCTCLIQPLFMSVVFPKKYNVDAAFEYSNCKKRMSSGKQICSSLGIWSKKYDILSCVIITSRIQQWSIVDLYFQMMIFWQSPTMWHWWREKCWLRIVCINFAGHMPGRWM